MPSRRRNSKNLSEKIIEDWHITEEGKDIPIRLKRLDLIGESLLTIIGNLMEKHPMEKM